MRLSDRLLDRCLVALYVAFAALPVIAMVTGLRGRELEGALAPSPRPALDGAAFLAERYQKAFAAWFESELGLKGTSISVDNTILYHAFRETKQGSSVRIGKDRVLFNDEDINYYNKNGPWLPDPAYIDLLADQIADLQRRLRAGQRGLVPVIVPAKTSIWRDKIPGAWKLDLGDPRPSDDRVYRAFRAALERRGVAFVDARQMFEALSAQGVPRADLFGPDARHWSVYGACLVMKEVATHYAQLTGRPRPPHECTFERVHRPRSNPDFDLLRLLNAMFAYPSLREVPFVPHAPPDPAIPKPRTLFIGTSFCWTLLNDAGESGAYGAMHLNYYDQTFVVWPERSTSPVVPASPAWRAVTMENDLYVLDLFEGYLAAPGAYVELFLKELLAELDRR
jgi:acetyltransferase AlgX (SGNH hydrolase-like protein)